MAFNTGTAHGKQNDQAKLADAAKADINKGAELGARATEAARDGMNKTADLQQTTINKSAELGSKATEVAREGISKAADLQQQAAENTKQIVQDGVESASHHAREASERLTRTLGFSGEGSERLANQSKRNTEAVTRCGTVLGQAFQDASRGWFDLGQKQWQRNLDGLNKLARSQSVQEFTAVQSELMRDGLQHMIQDSRTIAETSLRAIDEAGKTFSGVAQPGATQG